MKDVEWIPVAVNAGFVIISGDRNEKTRGFTVGDLKELRARVVLLGPFWDHLGRWDKAKWMVSRFEGIVGLAGAIPEGNVILVGAPGRPRWL